MFCCNAASSDSRMWSVYQRISGDLEMEGDLIFKEGKGVFPDSMLGEILRLAYEVHPGMSSMKRLIRSNFWWPGMDRLGDRVVRECGVCINSDKMLNTFPAWLKPVAWPKFPWQKVSFDISGL